MRVAAIGEVGVVRQVHREGDDAAVDEDRFGEDDVGQMRAATLVGVVAAEHVAWLHLLDRMALQDVRDQADEAAEMHRDVLGLAQRVAMNVEQRGRAVAAFLDVGGVGRADQRLAHFLDDRGEGTADHLDGDRIDPDRAGSGVVHAASRIRFRYGSTRAVMPGSTKVVASICSTMAGPAMRLPHRSRSRS